jgi:hypothetical protein
MSRAQNRVLITSLILVTTSLTILPANSANIAGTKCTKSGLTKIVSNLKFTCIKSGSKLIWNKGVAIKKQLNSVPNSATGNPTGSNPSTPTSTPEFENSAYGYDGPCSVDRDIPTAWVEVQEYFGKYHHCLGPVRVVNTVLTSNRPKTLISANSEYLNVNACKITAPSGFGPLRAWPSQWQNENFNTSAKLHPSPNSKILILPIYSTDTAQPEKSPLSDYGKYIDFFKSVIEYDSDNGSSFEMKIADKYFKLPKPILDYGVTQATNTTDQLGLRDAYVKDILNVTDSEIDFKGINMVIVVTPPGTPLSVSINGTLSQNAKADGQTFNISNATPYTLTHPLTGDAPSISPMWWLHELYHYYSGLGDHVGNDYWQNHFGNDPTQPGMGNWGLMAMAITDYLAMQKWVYGFISDNQVKCASKETTSTTWLSPSSIKSKEKKLLVIPISSTVAIAMESIRAGGLNFMLSHESEGLLVYKILLFIMDMTCFKLQVKL